MLVLLLLWLHAVDDDTDAFVVNVADTATAMALQSVRVFIFFSLCTENLSVICVTACGIPWLSALSRYEKLQTFEVVSILSHLFGSLGASLGKKSLFLLSPVD